ncbi:hypothetical protein BGW36DRAFT_389926 [Talaromyces proteolyticus]|uniref:Uncharacterized protein n=1 Tax=Talaromyces proteolyticus TaxID=1131652 RepID=A0AAD4KFF7_9EURO|nr:uncharacterized protein BGW36DRAFT_389926 [Talaromyces proteolyticus]KAH8689903.1 hypothetical protein BGW36DRAFT_389926 [Talaromyces proteolyticus]
MSSIPKARQSTFADITVTPDKWESYPEISRSTLSKSTLKDLSSENRIQRSEVSHSVIEDLPKKGKIRTQLRRSNIQNSHVLASQIERSELDHCTIQDSYVKRSKLAHCTAPARNRIERSTARATKFMSSKLVEKSELDDSVVLGGSTLEYCVVKNSLIADGTVCERTELDNVAITRSRAERSKLTDCDVMDCIIERTDFQGMVLKYGIWKNGDLVGRTAKEEVVIKPRHKPMDSSLVELPAVQSTSSPSDQREPGWKAAEAARERLGNSSGPDYASSSEDEPSSDDELIDPGPKSSRRRPNANSSAPVNKDNDPPPPYEA